LVRSLSAGLDDVVADGRGRAMERRFHPNAGDVTVLAPEAVTQRQFEESP
jgi:hypothetical protein